MSDAKESTDRRTFLKFMAAISAVLAVGGVGAVAKSVASPSAQAGKSADSSGFPRFKVANLSDLVVNNPVTFYYPLTDEPNILVKLGEKAEGGVGPDGDIVAFSQICQHLGCIYAYESPGSSPACNSSYKATGPVGYCCCHGSVYDFANAGKVLGGPAPRPVPQVILEVDSSGDIYAVGMDPPTIFGHNTGSSDVTSDLQGGTLVS
ncbi:MAG: arsenate reductase (azurin) small subunit [Nitrososphaerota archaeon]|nr:arsenate reductase (azurin) small subunit [Nitrososphaerota archaeon]